MKTTNNENSNKEQKVIRLNNFVSYELLKKMKFKEPDTIFILPNGKEAKLKNEKSEKSN